MARQFNLIPPICEQAEYHMFQREKVEVQLPELFHKIGGLPRPPRPAPPRWPRPLRGPAPRWPSPATPSPWPRPSAPAPPSPWPRPSARPAVAPPPPLLRPLGPPTLGPLGLTSPGFPPPGVGAMTWSPLACGIVSGKYDSGIPPYSRASLKVTERPGRGGYGRPQAFRTEGAVGADPGRGNLEPC